MEAIRKGLAGIELLFACRWVLWPRVPAVLARSLLAPWSGGISEHEARQAVVYARDCEPPFIRLLAQERAGGKLANLYVPAVAT
jgi:hypothetical protein